MDLKTAIQKSNEGDVIGWREKKLSYEIYRATNDAPDGVTPEFLVMDKTILPWALTETAVDALHGIIMEDSNV